MTYIDILAKLIGTDLSLLNDTRGVFFGNQVIIFNGKLYEGIGADVSGSVFYNCAMSCNDAPGALVIGSRTLSKQTAPAKFFEKCVENGLSLSGVDLSDVDMSKNIFCNLKDLDLSYTNLSGINFQRADLSGANLENAILIRTDLSNATMRGVDLYNANLTEANLEGANLTRARLNKNTVLEGIYAKDAIFDNCFEPYFKTVAKIGTPIFVGPFSNIVGASLTTKNLTHLNLLRSDFKDAEFLACNFDQSDLRGVSFIGAKIGLCSFKGSDIRGADFTDALIYGAFFEGALYDKTTKGLSNSELKDAKFV